MIKRGATISIVVICLLILTNPAMAQERLGVSAEQQVDTNRLSLYISLPLDLNVSLENYSLSITVEHKDWKASKNLIGEQIIAKSSTLEANILEYTFTTDEQFSEPVVVTIVLNKQSKPLSILKKLINVSSVNNKAVDGPLNETSLNNREGTNSAGRKRKDYRERYILGKIKVRNLRWSGFPLIIKAEYIEGGGVERARIVLNENGEFLYRLGNLYSRKYSVTLENYQYTSEPNEIDFSDGDYSKMLDFELPSVLPIDLGIYEFEPARAEQTEDGNLYYFQAYVCRFDNSRVQNFAFLWKIGDKIYKEHAPENNRCRKVVSDGIKIPGNEKSEVTMELISEPNEADLSGMILSESDFFAMDSNAENDKAIFQLNAQDK